MFSTKVWQVRYTVNLYLEYPLLNLRLKFFYSFHILAYFVLFQLFIISISFILVRVTVKLEQI